MAEAEVSEKPEDDLTNDERLSWLRARGVIVEEPASRKIAHAAGGRSFLYVRIPADESLECEQRSGPVCDGDGLPSLIGPDFAGGDVPDDMLEAKVAEMGQAVSIATLRSVLAQGGAEKFSLAVPTDSNGREGVYAYLDESSALKNLPINKRANTLAQQCGFPRTCEFFGDIFIGRQRWSKNGTIENIDFKLADLAPGSLWLRRAATENLETQKATRPDDHAYAQATGGSDEPASGQGDGYTWRDQGNDMEVVIEVEKGTSKKDIKIEFKKQEIRMTKPVAHHLKLFKPVDVDGCNWTVGNGQVILTLEKGVSEPWAKLLG